MLKQFLFISMFLSLFSSSIFSETGYITGDAVNIRESASIQAKVIGVVHFADLVKIIEKTKNIDNIQNIGSHFWYKIQKDKITGWVFGGFIVQQYCSASDKQYMVWAKKKDIYALVGATWKFFILSNNKLARSFDIQAADFSFSPSCQYIAFDDGTDVMGTITIYALPTGDKIYSDTYMPREIKWSDDKLKIRVRVKNPNSNSYCTNWEDVIFSDGKIQRTGKIKSIPDMGYDNKKCN